MNVVFRKSSSRNPNYIYVSTLLRIGDYNSLWNPIIQLYSSFSNEDLSKKPKIDFDIGDILPSLSTTSYFYYLGIFSRLAFVVIILVDLCHVVVVRFRDLSSLYGKRGMAHLYRAAFYWTRTMEYDSLLSKSRQR